MDDVKYLNIRETAELLGVSIITLRRWDKQGKLKAVRKGVRGHRLYRHADLELFRIDLFKVALDWAAADTEQEPEKNFYCQNSPIFQARLTYLTEDLKKIPELSRVYPIIVAIVSEIGDNSFAHNLGNWPDVIGIFFGYDINKREIVLADRGLGILTTLSRVRPSLKNHREALKVAFTEILSGRAPEARGNGLKFVRREIVKHAMSLIFHSGDAIVKIKKSTERLMVKKSKVFINGCFASIKF